MSIKISTTPNPVQNSQRASHQQQTSDKSRQIRYRNFIELRNPLKLDLRADRKQQLRTQNRPQSGVTNWLLQIEPHGHHWPRHKRYGSKPIRRQLKSLLTLWRSSIPFARHNLNYPSFGRYPCPVSFNERNERLWQFRCIPKRLRFANSYLNKMETV